MLSEFTPKGVRFKNSSLGTILKVPQSPPSDSVVGPGFALSVSESMSPGPKVSVKLSEELGLTMLADTATESLAGPPLGSTLGMYFKVRVALLLIRLTEVVVPPEQAVWLWKKLTLVALGDKETDLLL